MRKLLFLLLLVAGFVAKGQVYNNEWIDYSKTYYKFKVAKTGLYRIPQSVLATAGLGSAAAESFQLWRNGVQVPIYTSVTTGTLSGSDYIEFWGEMNDGKPDKQLYRDPDYQLNDKWSLLSDSAAYFLTVNTGGNNLRLVNTANNVAGNTLAPEPYFMYTAGMYYKERINNGWAVNVGQYLYSSSYDKGEGWSSGDIYLGATTSTTFNNLFIAANGPNPTFKIAVSGNAIRLRNYRVKINGDSVLSGPVDFFEYTRGTVSFPLSLLTSNAAAIQVTNICNDTICDPNDRMVVHQYEFTYPRQFNFGGSSNFEFSLPASGAGNYLEISGFTYGPAAPVLYDLTNGKRYVADISTAQLVKVVLEPSATERRLVLVSEAAGNVNSVASMKQRNFIDYSSSANQGDYIIISNPLLFNGANGANPVEEYRAYRSSAIGGGFDAKVCIVDELVDQFAFGINKHPLGIRNFLLFARTRFIEAPKQVFLIGKAVNYIGQRVYENNADINKLNLVPTFGWPASDVLLTANPGSSFPEIPVGRLSAINAQEVSDYLKKVKEQELAQNTPSPNRQDKEWMKNVVHLNGISEPELKPIIERYFYNYKHIISDTLFGGKVTTFTKSSTDAVQEISSSQLQTLFKDGISLITYFGHSGSSTLEFNLENPSAYQNQGKYPLFIALGCNAGDFFNFNTSRLVSNEAISEKYVLARDKGTIGFIASTHFGIVHYLDIWSERFYKAAAVTDYGKSLGKMMQTAARTVFDFTSQEDFYARTNVEQTELHGDPALKLNPHERPDYVVDESFIKVSPGFISVAESAVKVNVSLMNIGKAVADSIEVEVKRQYPNQTAETVYKKTIPGIRYKDSISFVLPIDALRDKGINKLTVTIDAADDVAELFETNNTAIKDFLVYEDEIRPVYPYNFAIVNKPNSKLFASTANAFSPLRQYRMELDTTELFNSPLKVTKNISSSGGVIEFEPGLAYVENTVYYWRVGQVTSSEINWKGASFIYLPNHELGFNQSHVYQHFKSEGKDVVLDSVTGIWKYGYKVHNIFARNAMFPTGGNTDGDFSVSLDGDAFIRSACVGRSILFNVIDPNSFEPWRNVDANGNSLYLYGSGSASCRAGRQYNFEFSYMTPESRKKIMDFMDVIPVGAFVVVRSMDYSYNSSFSSAWRADTAMYGSNNSLYHKLLNVGFKDIDSIDRPRSWALIYQKGVSGFEVKYAYTQGIYDKITVSADVLVPTTNGTITSPLLGPAKAWKQLQWTGQSSDAGVADKAMISILGIKQNGSIDTLATNIGPDRKVVDLSTINANQYPNLQLYLKNEDTVYHTPYQLQTWRLTYDPVPEGALAPNLYLEMKDSVESGEPLVFKTAFKNISESPFDSVLVKLTIIDRNNVPHVLQNFRYKPLAANDTLQVVQLLDSRKYLGVNSLFLDVNPANDQPEQYHFNNFAYRNFTVMQDTLNPLLDVTFDNVHILNNDIISSKPDILIQMKDEAKWSLLNDTSLVDVKVKYPNGSSRTFYFNQNDTLKFTAAQNSSNNTATINFQPYFDQDGTYELSVTGKDKSDNQAGSVAYRIAFEVYNKPMISNLLNYPNPFTTSAAFVFTVTGSEVPQEFKVQILTITGKVVREITRQELGALHIGRNITEYKWDGTDQYGQKLANGVYLYRLVTSLDGKTLDKFKAQNDNTDKYFNKGYGKMYLMR